MTIKYDEQREKLKPSRARKRGIEGVDYGVKSMRQGWKRQTGLAAPQQVKGNKSKPGKIRLYPLREAPTYTRNLLTGKRKHPTYNWSSRIN